MKTIQSNIYMRPVYKQGGFSTMSLIVVLFVLSLISLDIYQRFFVGQSVIKPRLLLEPLTPIKTLQLSSAHVEKLRGKYAQFTQKDDDSSADISEDLLSQEQQALQRGELQTVFVGTKSLKLRAILHDTQNVNRSYALVEVSDVTSKATSVEKVIDRDGIEGFELTIVSGTAVILSRTLSEEVQTITLSMYRSDNISNPGIE
jgi:hypothetical protein